MKTVTARLRHLALAALALAFLAALAGGDASAAIPPAAAEKALAELERMDADYNFSASQKRKIRAILEKQQADIAVVQADSSLSPAAKKEKINAITRPAYRELTDLFTPAQKEIQRQKLAADRSEPSSWLIPGNGFEPVAKPSIGFGETSYLSLPDGRVLTARGDHIAVSTNGMKTFPEK
ncbi:MAG: hypothetical protein LBI02_00830, partial [Opitutaceae bacterium]|nr:hypothetical protein [Opitutaceae bacterium]